LPKIVIADPIFERIAHWETGPGWFGPGYDLVWPEGYSTGEIMAVLGGAEGVVTCFEPFTAEMMDACGSLKVVAKPGAGYNNIDLAAATERGVMVCNVEGVRGRAVAEHALFHMLYLSRNGWLKDRPEWESTSMQQLGGKSIGIVGLGDIGANLARMADGFGLRVLVNTRKPVPGRVPGVEIEYFSFGELLPRVDYLVLCMPLTDETRGIVCAESISKMKKGAFLINVARGPVAVTEDMLDAVREGRLAGLGLDVTDPEPLPGDHPLRSIPNVLLSPHHASRTRETDAAALGRTAENIRLALSGERPINLVNPEVFGGPPN
jgi:phosphoglycerate dehydrogenase-like enzyme